MQFTRSTWRTVLERDLDLAIFDLLHTCESFSRWILSTTLGEDQCSMDFTGAWHSVIGVDGRESDLEVEWANANGERIRYLIENKIDAQCQPDQAVSYQQRAQRYLAGGVWKTATVLVAPEGYRQRHPADTEPFDFTISIEAIVFWIQSTPEVAARSNYLSDLFQQMLNKYSRYRPARPNRIGENEIGSDAHGKLQLPELHSLIREELERSFPQLRTSNSTPGEWVYFTFPCKSKGVLLRFRARDHWVELVLPKKSFDEDVVEETLRDAPLPEGHFAKRGKTEVVVWRPTEELDLDSDLPSQVDRIRTALLGAADLAAWYGANVEKFKETATV